MRLSVLLVTYNEESTVREAIESIRWADEIVVVDSYSTDRTVEICRELGCRIFQRPWPGFREQKNFALEQCQGEWVLNLDADERVSPELKASIQAALQDPKDCVGFEIKRHTWFLGGWIDHSGWYPNDIVLRLFQRDKGRWGGYEPHASVEVEGRVGKLEGDLYHYPYRDLAHHLEKMNRYSTSRAKALLAQGRKSGIKDLALRPVADMLKKLILKQGYRDGMRGLIVALLTAFSVFLKYAKVWEVRQNEALGRVPNAKPEQPVEAEPKS